MAWFCVHEEIVDSPKLRKLSKSLGREQDSALGLLNMLWKWALRNADKNGYLIEADESDVESAFAGKTSLPCSLVVASMIDTGWIDKENGHLKIHDWEERQEQWYKALEKRESENARKKNYRAKINEEMESNEFAADFEKFWNVYPRHVDKQAAFKCYCTRRKSGWTADEILEATRKYAYQCKHLGTQQSYIKHPKTFLGPNEPFSEFLDKKIKQKEETVDLSNPFAEYAEVS